MPSFYMHADALLVSLKDEPIFAMTIPGKLQSYLASGVPVIAMLNGEGAEIVDGAGAGLTCPAGDGSALVAALRQMEGMDSESRKRMGQRGRSFSKQEFDRGTIISRLLSWLEDLSMVEKKTKGD
jgi:glycosyltransferase involved in cell wall biosynthesis